MPNKLELAIYSSITTLIIGLILGVSTMWPGHYNDRAKTITTKEGMRIIKVDSIIGKDKIYVDPPQDNSSEYLTLEKYLDGFDNIEERITEKSRIMRLLE